VSNLLSFGLFSDREKIVVVVLWFSAFLFLLLLWSCWSIWVWDESGPSGHYWLISENVSRDV